MTRAKIKVWLTLYLSRVKIYTHCMQTLVSSLQSEEYNLCLDILLKFSCNGESLVRGYVHIHVSPRSCMISNLI